MASGSATAPSLPAASLLRHHRIGRSTPDSEVLASSDDEHADPHMTASFLSTRSNPSAATNNGNSGALPNLPKPTRRPSWLSEIQPNSRRFSINASSALIQGNGSQPTTPSSEVPPQTTMPPLTSVSPLSAAPSFPFSIPLQPTIKAHRSASYSIGQRDAAKSNAEPAAANTSSIRTRPNNPSVTRRASRLPTLPDLNEDRRDPTLGDIDLGRDEEISSDEGDGFNMSQSTSPFAAHNARVGTTLRRQATENLRTRHRGSMNSNSSNFNRLTHSATAPMYSDPDIAIEEMEPSLMNRNYAQGRRFSEFQGTNHPLGNMSRGQWSSVQGMNGINDEQGRRHSFAIPSQNLGVQRYHDEDTDEEDHPAEPGLSRSQTHDATYDPHGFGVPLTTVPSGPSNHDNGVGTESPTSYYDSTQHQNLSLVDSPRSYQVRHEDGSIGANLSPAQDSHPEGNPPLTDAQREWKYFVFHGPTEEESMSIKHVHDRSSAVNYFNGIGPMARALDRPRPSEDANPYAVPSYITPPARILHMVAFKCSRADVYYVPDNSGLELNIGDIVWTEGDRGSDMGMVTHTNIRYDQIKDLRKLASIEHFKCMTSFSRKHEELMYRGISRLCHAADKSAGVAGGMGPQNSLQPAMLNREDIKPKLIKHRASPHDIKSLMDKEAAEAKAKRVCQMKVNEYGLKMEILDAEYQMDYKKLTFFYYAESYVNFNDLVTDLFKTYKTRIWLHAITADSLQPPSTGFNPHGFDLAPGAVRSRRTNRQNPLLPATYSGMPSTMAPYQNVAGMQNFAPQNFGPYGNGPAANNMPGYAPGIMPNYAFNGNGQQQQGFNNSRPASRDSQAYGGYYAYSSQPQSASGTGAAGNGAPTSPFASNSTPYNSQFPTYYPSTTAADSSAPYLTQSFQNMSLNGRRF